MDVIMRNYNAVDAGVEGVQEILIPSGWAEAQEEPTELSVKTERAELAQYVKDIMILPMPCGETPSRSPN